MTRLLLSAPLLALLAACAPANGPDVPRAGPADGPVTIPMDPGQITCAQVTSNPGYLSAATDWADGRWRAATLSGALPGPVPDRATLSGSIAAYCGSYPAATARDAYGALIAG